MKTYTMLFVKNYDKIKAIGPIFLTQYNKIKHVQMGPMIQVFKKDKIHSFFQIYIHDSINQFLKNIVCRRSFNVNSSNTTQPYL